MVQRDAAADPWREPIRVGIRSAKAVDLPAVWPQLIASCAPKSGLRRPVPRLTMQVVVFP